MKTKKDYSERTDIEKIQSNWTKINGLFSREEWSSAILRASTAVEISANYVVRQELELKRNLEPEFVNHLLKWANGVQGKFDKLLVPIFKGSEFQKELKKLNKKVRDINKERNLIAHSGQFKKKSTAKRIIEESEIVINTLIKKYDNDFKLKKQNGKR
ncbi:hypothetical protein [Leeuwenhoekiella sp. ZYFB001]|uniref:hypothetical protein n=1 Tax=Leeuwenhoekiella sp. ZYFB001 TaxID=2719912 RepID=UPI0014306FD8|nr:hypothetical protein [Leeuwenhoekiella sp. ZYFB001]